MTMNMFKHIICFAGVFICFLDEARAQDLSSAKSLSDGCAVANAVLDGTADQRFGGSPTDAEFGERMIKAGTCYGYIEGFRQGFSAGRGAPTSFNACIPDAVTTGQIARVVEDRMKRMPEFEHLDRMQFVTAILRATWPCK